MEMTTVPANAPNDVESTGILSVVELMIVAVAVMFTAVQFPVPPVRVMVGKDDKSKPWPPEIVKTTGALDVSRDAAAREARRAIAAARQLPVNPHSACLIQLAAQLLERDH